MKEKADVYTIDLTHLSLDAFEDILANTELLPSRRMLQDDLAGVIDRLRQRGVTHLADLQALLRNKKRYPDLAAELTVSIEYLTLLNREVNSYVAKPVALAKLNVFAEDALARLKDAGVKSSKDLYQRSLTPDTRQALAKAVDLPEAQLTHALTLADLLRINGVGPVFALLLHEMGIKHAADFLQADADDLLRRYQDITAAKDTPQPKLGRNDIDYCKRFCALLDMDIVW